MHLIVYSAELCGDCQNLKKFLDDRGIEYETRDIRKEPQHATDLEAKTGKLGVPYIILNGEWKRGYNPGEPFTDEFAEQLLGLR